jgi:hypothetical protein
MSFDVTVDTSSVATQTGAIYLQFNPGLNSDPATVTITNFLIGGSGSLLSSPPIQIDGDVTGALSAPPLIIGNTSGLNDYLHFLLFGDTLSFRSTISTTVSGAADSGSAFLIGLTSDDGLSPILTNDPGGFLAQVISDLQGNYAADSLSSVATITPAVSAVPEPSSLSMAAAAVTVLWFLRGSSRRRRSARTTQLDVLQL